MSDDELKRLLQGLFSDEPIEVAPSEIPPGEPVPASPPRPAGRDRRDESDRIAEVDRSQGLLHRLWASSQAISTVGDVGQIGQALMEFAAEAGVDVARLLVFVDGTDGPPTTLEMCDGWTIDDRPAQPYGTRLPLSSYPLLDFMQADQPVVVQDVTTDPRANDTVRTFMAIAGVASFFIVPLSAGQKWLGALFLGRNSPSSFADDLIEVSWTLAGQAAMSLQYLKRMEELQRTLRTLAQRDAEQSALIDNIPDGIYFKDAESRFTRINRYQADVLLGSYETEVALGKSDWDFYAPEFAEQAWNDERRIIESKQPLIGRIEKTIRRSDGQERWVSATKIPLTDDKGEITGLVGISRDITELKMAQEQAQRRATELQLAAEISKAASSLLDPEELMQQAVKLLADRFGLYYAGLFLVDDTGEWAVLRAGTGKAGWAMIKAGHRLAIGGQSMIGQCVANAKAGIALDVGAESFRFDNPLLPETRSELALPLISRGRAIGGLTIQSDAEAAFSEEDIAALQTMADQLANAVENARLFQEMQQRTLEFQALYDVALSLGTQMERQELLRLIVEQAVALLEAEAGGFYLHDAEAGELVFSVATGYFADFVGIHLKPGEGLAGQVFQNRRSEAVSDYHTWSSRAGVYEKEARLHNLLAVPLAGRAGVLGVLDIAGGKKGGFSPQDVRLAELFAAQAAVTLENLELLEDSRRRAAELEALNEVGRAATSVLDLDSLLGQIVSITKERFGHYFVGIALVEGDRLIVRSGSTVGDTGGRMQLGVDVDLASATSLIAEAARTRQPVLVNDVLSDPRYMAVDELPGTRAELDVPIEVKGRVVGVLTVQSDRVGAYDETAVAILQSLASQAGAAIDNARLFEEAQVSARELAVLNDMGRALGRVLTVDAVVDSIHHYVSQLMDATNFYVALYDAEKDEISFPLYRDGEQARRDVAGRRSGKGMTEYVIRTRQPLLVKDNLDTLLVELGIESIGQSSYSWLGVPMMIGEQPIGIITVQSYTTPRVYDEHARDLLTAVASQAAIAIQNARLFEQTQAALAETEARARRERLGREITANVRASIDPDTIMQTAVRELGTALGRPAFVRVGNAVQLSRPPGASPAPPAVDDEVRRSIHSATLGEDQTGHNGGRGRGKRRRGGK